MKALDGKKKAGSILSLVSNCLGKYVSAVSPLKEMLPLGARCHVRVDCILGRSVGMSMQGRTLQPSKK